LRGIYGPVTQGDVGYYRALPDHALWLSGPGPTRHVEPTRPQVSEVRDLWLLGGSGNKLRRCPRLGRGAYASVECGNDPKDGGDHGHLSDPVDILRPADCFATDHCMERDRCGDELLKRRRVPLFCP